MGKHAKPILVRFYRDGEDAQFVLVKDWENFGGWARFTLPKTSAVGRSLMTDGLCKLRVVVMESEEVEWKVDRVDRALKFPPGGGPYEVTCRSLVGRLRDSEPTDLYVIAKCELDD